MDFYILNTPQGTFEIKGTGLILVSKPLDVARHVSVERLDVRFDIDEPDDFLGIEIGKALAAFGNEISAHSGDDPLAFIGMSNSEARAIQGGLPEGKTIMEAIRGTGVISHGKW
jgi:hypothetical protein